MTIESIENNIFDVAGVRVICSFIDDIYEIEKLFLVQEDIELINRKDYIENPKPSGYRSLHLIVRTPHLYRKWEKEHVCRSSTSYNCYGLLGNSRA